MLHMSSTAICLPSSSVLNQWVVKLSCAYAGAEDQLSVFCSDSLPSRWSVGLRNKHGSLQYSKGVYCLVVQPRDSHRSKPSILLPPQRNRHRTSHIRVGQAIVSFLMMSGSSKPFSIQGLTVIYQMYRCTLLPYWRTVYQNKRPSYTWPNDLLGCLWLGLREHKATTDN